MNGLSGGVSAVGDVKPRCQQAPEILRTGLGISAFRRAGSGSGTLAIGAYATGRRRRQSLSRRKQSPFFPFADHVVLLDLHTLQANDNDDDKELKWNRYIQMTMRRSSTMNLINFYSLINQPSLT